MILLFKKNVKDKQYLTNADIGLETTEDFKIPEMALLSSFFAPTENISTTCTYPLNIRELFPYWIRISNQGQSVLISITEQYYKWLSCNMTDINTLSFFNLEDLIDLENIPEDLIQHLAFTYLNSLPKEEIEKRTVSFDKLKNIIDNVKTNLYGKKGTKDSFKLIINEFFGVDPDKISISYPKNYVLRLNSGRYDWMRANPQESQIITSDYPEFLATKFGSFLNYSVIYDSDLWQDYSYVLNTPGVSLEAYENIIKPLLHPAGTKGFFEIRYDIFNNNVQDVSITTEYESPAVQNYALYTIASTQTIGYTFGCSGAYGGVTGEVSHVFPYWDEEISDYYISGMSFGEINTGDFFTLTPATGYTFLNTGLTCG